MYQNTKEQINYIWMELYITIKNVCLIWLSFCITKKYYVLKKRSVKITSLLIVFFYFQKIRNVMAWITCTKKGFLTYNSKFIKCQRERKPKAVYWNLIINIGNIIFKESLYRAGKCFNKSRQQLCKKKYYPKNVRLWVFLLQICLSYSITYK